MNPGSVSERVTIRSRTAGRLFAVSAIAFLGIAAAAGAAPDAARPGAPAALSTDDLKPAVTLINRASAVLNEAAKRLEANQTEEARAELAKAEKLFGAVQRLLAEPEDQPEQARPTLPGRLRAPPRHGRLPLAPAAPGKAAVDEDNGDGWRDPFDLLRAMQQQFEQMDRAWGAVPVPDWGGRAFAPDTDVADDGTHYIVKFDVPGADKSRIDVRVEGRLLTVSGTTDAVKEEKDKDRLIRSERRMGQFQRIVTVPGPVKADKVEARCEKGVLTVTIEKADESPVPSSIPVI